MIGVDEVGRGCLAGPLLVVAARATSKLPEGLKDSKLLSKKQREEILNKLSICCEFGEGWVKCVEIDNYGLGRALKLGAARALRDLGAAFDEEIILDGKFNYLPKKFTSGKAIVGADNTMPSVSAASIYAKVTRDRYMIEMSGKYPLYGFDKHVGYGTKTHMLALSTYGAIKYVHRFTFSPVANISEEILLKQPNKD